MAGTVADSHFDRSKRHQSAAGRVLRPCDATDTTQSDDKAFYAGHDQLLTEFSFEFDALIKFIVSALQKTISQANAVCGHLAKCSCSYSLRVVGSRFKTACRFTMYIRTVIVRGQCLLRAVRWSRKTSDSSRFR